jgi:hypothetical protein
VIECAAEPVAYQPARPLNRISATEVLDTLHRAGTTPSELEEDPLVQNIVERTRLDGELSVEDLLTGLPTPPETKPDDADHAGT